MSHNNNGLSKLYAAIEAFRSLDPGIASQTVATFLLVSEAGPNGITPTELMRKLRLSQAAISRNIFALSRYKVRTEPGLDLVSSEMNPVNRREKLVVLTQRGEALVRKLNTMFA